ncbi:MAG: HEAT repeat domain-containing protein [Elainellaceae cyanobacterium]
MANSESLPEESLQKLLQAVDDADSVPRIIGAVAALAASRSEAAIPKLIEVLGYNNPGAAVAAVDGLVKLGEPAVMPLLEQLDGYNYGARAWAVRALAGIADPRGLDILLSAAQNDFALSVRRAAAKGLGTIEWALMDEAQVESAQEQALNALIHVVATDVEWVVRYSGIVGLQALAEAIAPTRAEWRSRILNQFQAVAEKDETLAVRTRAVYALEVLSQSTDHQD